MYRRSVLKPERLGLDVKVRETLLIRTDWERTLVHIAGV
jgi:hypothetical protein